MARMSWLDETSNLPLIEEKVQQLEHYTKAMADGIVDKGEVEEQQNRLIAAMKEVEGKLDDELHEKVTSLLVELTAYDMMRMLHEIQTERARRAFGE